MSAKDALDQYLAPILVPGETVAVTTTVQVKGGMKKQLGKAFLAGAAASAVIGAATGGGMGVLVVAVPPAAWAVVTSHRVLLVERVKGGSALGRLIFDAPRAALTATLKSGLLNEITLTDASDGQSLIRLNVGVKRGTANAVVSAISG